MVMVLPLQCMCGAVADVHVPQCIHCLGDREVLESCGTAALRLLWHRLQEALHIALPKRVPKKKAAAAAGKAGTAGAAAGTSSGQQQPQQPGADGAPPAADASAAASPQARTAAGQAASPALEQQAAPAEEDKPPR